MGPERFGGLSEGEPLGEFGAARKGGDTRNHRWSALQGAGSDESHPRGRPFCPRLKGGTAFGGRESQVDVHPLRVTDTGHDAIDDGRAMRRSPLPVLPGC